MNNPHSTSISRNIAVPHSTARLQFHKDFTLDHATELVDYYAQLGVSHLYASPILTARKGSTHGYDIVDPTAINPELGGEPALRRLVAKLRSAGMGLIVDIVPNHMGVGGNENAWWLNVLEWGEHSRYARWFDIDWRSHNAALHGKLQLPFLGMSYAETLQSGDLKLCFDEATGQLYFGYHAHRFPLAPASYSKVLLNADPALLSVATEFAGLQDDAASAPEQHARACAALREIARTADGKQAIAQLTTQYEPTTPEGAERLHALLELQHYRLTWWRNAAEEINWRRFFEVSDLAGVRVELDEVFDATHGLILQLYAEGLIDGVRVDHVDGMAYPGAYCRKLRAELEARNAQRPAELQVEKPFIVIEKILTGAERVRLDWQVDGTTGYEFMDQVGALLHDPAGAEPLTNLWNELSGSSDDFSAHVKAARRQLLAGNLVGEFDALGRALHAVAAAELETRDVALAAIRRVLTEVLVVFPVYRTYVNTSGRDQLDDAIAAQVIAAASSSVPPADLPLLATLMDWLGGVAPDSIQDQTARDLRLRAITRFQQLTPPLAAKSVEDTAFYRYGRLLSRNEVGSDPGHFAISVEEFHQENLRRLEEFPRALIATATHDHKRGEGVRARIAVLSELPAEWGTAVQYWLQQHAPLVKKIVGSDGAELAAPQTGDLIMLYQMLVGAWPLGLKADDAEGRADFAKRIGDWQEKALREAKQFSSWALSNVEYEQACRDFLQQLLVDQAGEQFVRELVSWAERITPAGICNSLTQTLLRLTAPGIPDLYQGTEFWDQSLVDPDNRRPVDYAARQQALNDMHSIAVLDNLDGKMRVPPPELKQQLIQSTLALRNRLPGLFEHGDYVPLSVTGPMAQHVIAYLRRDADSAVLIAALRLPLQSLTCKEDRFDASALTATMISLPADCATVWQDVLHDAELNAEQASLPLERVLGRLPVGLLLASTLLG